jgi:hypothetical protein
MPDGGGAWQGVDVLVFLQIPLKAVELAAALHDLRLIQITRC